MIEPHPITPPTELVEQWLSEGWQWHHGTATEYAITQAARWGADQELDACCDWVENECPGYGGPYEKLRTFRRPKPPSLKEQALDSWDRLRNEAWCEEIDFDLDFIRRALEKLND